MLTKNIFLLLAAYRSSMVFGAKQDTCIDQNPCIEFTSNQIHSSNSQLVLENECSYKVCAVFNLGAPGCTIDHIFFNRTRNVVMDRAIKNSALSGFESIAADVQSGYTQCQNVAGGGNVEFIFADGGTCKPIQHEVPMMIHYTKVNGLSVTCSPKKKSNEICNTKSMTTSECVWTVQAPPCAQPAAGTMDNSNIVDLNAPTTILTHPFTRTLQNANRMKSMKSMKMVKPTSPPTKSPVKPLRPRQPRRPRNFRPLIPIFKPALPIVKPILIPIIVQPRKPIVMPVKPVKAPAAPTRAPVTPTTAPVL